MMFLDTWVSLATSLIEHLELTLILLRYHPTYNSSFLLHGVITYLPAGIATSGNAGSFVTIGPKVKTFSLDSSCSICPLRVLISFSCLVSFSVVFSFITEM